MMRQFLGIELVLIAALLAIDVRLGNASAVYTYLDDKGTPVATDSLQNVPQQYRDRVKRIGTPDPWQEGPAVARESRGQTVKVPSVPAVDSIITSVANKVPQNAVKGLNQYQTAVLIVGGGAGVFLMVMLFLSSNPAITLLSKWMLVFVVCGTAFYMYFGGAERSVTASTGPSGEQGQPPSNVVQQMRSKTQESYQLQEQRTQQQIGQ